MHVKETKNQPQGFALPVTIILMMLLMIIAIGLLSLSQISLRTAGQSDAMATARSNARLALMLAIGDLQKSLGPDKAVTATSEILSTAPAKCQTTGAWESWDFDPGSATHNYDSEKSSRFRRWLVSSAQPSDAENRDFVTAAWSGKTIELVGDGAFGGTAPANSKVEAGRVPISTNGSVRGAFAWHVSDESVKARINLYRDPALNDTVARKRALLAGHRPDPSVMKGSDGSALDFLPNDHLLDSFQIWNETVGKVTGLNQVDLLTSPGNAPGKIKPFRNHVTPYSLGLLTNVRNGGLKQDLSSVFELSQSAKEIQLPAEFREKRLYQSTHGGTGVSDPYWSALSSYYNTFRSVTSADSSPQFYKLPAEKTTLTSLAPPKYFSPVPVIAKVEFLFAFITRDSHGPWVAPLKQQDSDMNLMGHLMFTPLVTLHNPYNINITFDRMRITMANVPVAFNFYVNNTPQSSRLVSMNELFISEDSRQRQMEFVMNIANWSQPGSASTQVSGAITLKPGQSLVCGPYLDPNANFNTKEIFFDIKNDLTANMKAKPGFAGPCVGFDIDWLTPIHGGLSSGQQTDNNMGVLGLRATDQVRFEYAVHQPTVGQRTAFQVSARMTVGTTSYDCGGLDFKYGDNSTLNKLFPAVYNCPPSGSFQASDTYVPNTDPISRHANAKTFSVFSAYARTTSGGVYDNGSRTPTEGGLNFLRDGRLAGMPFLHHNPARTVMSIDLAKEKPGSQSHELNFQQFLNRGQVEDYFNLDRTNRTACITGNTTQRGIKSGSYLELPTGPMQTIADFRRSNALTSSYLPTFVQPVSNSRVSPLMSTDRVRMTDANIAAYELLDHSVLANHALYDRFYFSTFATDGGSTPEQVFENFMNGDAPLLSQAFQSYLPAGETIAGAKGKLFNAGKPTDISYQKLSAYQMVRGAFNVNSTSVQAWKAMLASINKGDIVTLWAKSANLEIVKASGIPILPMSLINGGVAGDAGGVDPSKIDDSRTNDWNSHQELTDAELETLATKIVDEVRKRGPFLSMSEFVNRRIGPDSELTRMGTLEAAITNSGINDKMFKDQVRVTADDIGDVETYPFKTPLASVGNPAAGAPGWVSQGDLMRLLEPAATVRSDTFVIRVCGEAQDAKGNVTARAYAEAVVQRVPEYVDPENAPSLNVYTDAGAKDANKKFGRRINVVSFRWLAKEEI